MTEMIENKTFAELAVGDHAEMSRALRHDDVETWAAVIGNVNVLHAFGDTPDETNFSQGSGQTMWAATLFSTIAGSELPGLGTVARQANIRFHRSVPIGERVTARVTIRELHEPDRSVILDCQCIDSTGALLISGELDVVAPQKKIRRAVKQLPSVQLRREDRYLDLIGMCEGLPALSTAVVHPCSDDALRGAIDAAERHLITPVLIGPERKIRAMADAENIDISPYQIVASEHSHHSAELGVSLVRTGECQTIMKGSLHTDELLHEVMRKENGLRTERRISHCFLISVPTFPRPIIVTDAAINIFPTLEEKVDIVQNAIELAHAIGIEIPKVAILSAVETVTPKIPSTLEAAALCKMADRGQIRGGLLDGPLAFDNAVDEAAARTKGITSPVAGLADILVVPDLEAGNMIAKQLTFMADADAAGIVIGARAPVILTSRADNARARLASCALAVLFAEAQRRSMALLKAAE